jgi:hypothetical protein
MCFDRVSIPKLTERRDDGYYHTAAGVPSLPLMYSIRAVKPAN